MDLATIGCPQRDGCARQSGRRHGECTTRYCVDLTHRPRAKCKAVLVGGACLEDHGDMLH